MSSLDINLGRDDACANGQAGVARRPELCVQEGREGGMAASRRVDSEMGFAAAESGPT